MALISLKFSDPNSCSLRDLVLRLGKWYHHKPPIEQSATRRWFCDVRLKEKFVYLAQSESAVNFPWHTDCSYESSPPRFCGFHVRHADRNGGGTLLALEASMIIREILYASQRALFRREYCLKVPQEFFKGTPDVNDSLLC